jgi:hypothetical protein
MQEDTFIATNLVASLRGSEKQHRRKNAAAFLALDVSSEANQRRGSQVLCLLLKISRLSRTA